MEQDFNVKHWSNPCPKYNCRKNNCKCGLRYVNIPAVLGDDSADSDVAPKNGNYCNTIVEYEANGHKYIYTSEGIPVLISSESSEQKTYNLDYSVVEVDTGMTWVDGKKIYRKTIHTYGLMPNGADSVIPHDITDLGEVIKIEGYAKNDTDGIWIDIPSYSQFDNEKAIAYVSVTSDNIIIGTPNDSLPMNSFNDSYVTLYYTKGN